VDVFLKHGVNLWWHWHWHSIHSTTASSTRYLLAAMVTVSSTWPVVILCCTNKTQSTHQVLWSHFL